MKPTFFPTQSEFRNWFEEHSGTLKELWVGFYKKDSGKPSITWPESVDVALCFGWIDGVRKSINQNSYMIRFTPRKPKSRWSAINIRKVKELQKLGLMRPAGLKLFKERKEKVGYSYDHRESVELDSNSKKQFKANKEAWNFFQKQPPWYQKVSIYWVVSAKQEETRARRLLKLIEASERGKRL